MNSASTAPGKVTAGSGGAVDSECTTPGGRVTAGSRSLCAPYAGVIAGMAADGLTAQRIWMELRSGHGFGGSYEAVKRFVHRLREAAPQRVWRVESEPGEEVQVDFMQGPAVGTGGGKRSRTWILCMVLSFSHKGYSEADFRHERYRPDHLASH